MLAIHCCVTGESNVVDVTFRRESWLTVSSPPAQVSLSNPRLFLVNLLALSDASSRLVGVSLEVVSDLSAINVVCPFFLSVLSLRCLPSIPFYFFAVFFFAVIFLVADTQLY